MLNHPLTLAACCLVALSLPACDDSGDGGDTTTTTTSSSGSGGTSSGGGCGGTGGTTSGGGGTAGAGGTTSSGGGTPPFWTDDYVPGQLPTPSDGHHNAGVDCMTCHGEGSNIRLFAGTIYQSDGTTPAPSVQIGVRDGDTLRTTYSATNGNFWFSDDSGTIQWATASIRARNGNGEVTMYGSAAAGCNSCHTSSFPITEP